MTERDRARCAERARVIKAMAHPSRLFIMERLAERDHCVCELTAMIGSDVSTVSKHLAVLRNAGIVADRKEGTMVYYTLQTPCLLKYLACVEAVLDASTRRQLAALSRT